MMLGAVSVRVRRRITGHVLKKDEWVVLRLIEAGGVDGARAARRVEAFLISEPRRALRAELAHEMLRACGAVLGRRIIVVRERVVLERVGAAFHPHVMGLAGDVDREL